MLLHGHYRCYSFDLDHTLVRYKQNASSTLIFRCLARYLVDQCHYPSLLLKVAIRQDFLTKGILVDGELGNLLKIDASRRVVNGYHGFRALSHDDIRRLYPEPLPFDGDNTTRYSAHITSFDIPAMPLYAQLVQMVADGTLLLPPPKPVVTPTAVGTISVTTPSSLSSSSPSSTDSSTAAAPDVLSPPTFERLRKDIIGGFGWNFAQSDKGYYFGALSRDPGRYIYRRPDVRQWLIRIRQAGVRLFMVTNSKLDYATCLCDYAFGKDWASLFDITIVYGQKPKFFTHTPPFFEVDMKTLGRGRELSSDGTELKLGGSIYWEGNHRALDKLFQRYRRTAPTTNATSTSSPTPTPVPSSSIPTPSSSDAKSVATSDDNDGLKVIYFGDHLKTDVVATRQYTSWTAAAIVEELVHHHHDHHHHHLHDHDHGHRHIHDEQRSSSSPSPSTTPSATPSIATASTNEEKGGRSRNVKKYTALGVADSWGSFFHAPLPPTTTTDTNPDSTSNGNGNGTSGDTTSFWSSYVSTHSHLVLPCLSLLARAPLHTPMVHHAGTKHCYTSYERVLTAAASLLDDDYNHDGDAPHDDDELCATEMTIPHYGF